jgi:hypothetical protein
MSAGMGGGMNPAVYRKTMAAIQRMTADLSAYPDLVVIYLGMRVQSLKGLITLGKLGPAIQNAVAAKPDGLLLHEPVYYSFFPLHVGMRQYWRDFDSLEAWARALPHKRWWGDFVRQPAGVGFWHETYFRRGGVESVFDEMTEPVGFLKFGAPVQAVGRMFSARDRRDAEAGTE